MVHVHVAFYIAWRTNQVEYGIPSILTVMTLVHAYLRKITLLAMKQEQRNTVDLFEN